MSLDAQGLGIALSGRSIFSGVDLHAPPGAVVGLVGPNGEGKTTLLRALSGITPPTAGHVRIDGRDLHRIPARERARLVGALFAPPDTTFGFTARELVTMGRYPHLGRAFEGEADRAAADSALSAMDLMALADTPIHTLSAGERQRVGIARLLCQRPATYLFDEPTSNLDPAHVERFVRVVRGLAQAGAAVVCVVHDLDLALRLSDRLVVLAKGRVQSEGEPAAVLTPLLIEAVWGVSTARVDSAVGRPALIMAAPKSTTSHD